MFLKESSSNNDDKYPLYDVSDPDKNKFGCLKFCFECTKKIQDSSENSMENSLKN